MMSNCGHDMTLAYAARSAKLALFHRRSGNLPCASLLSVGLAILEMIVTSNLSTRMCESKRNNERMNDGRTWSILHEARQQVASVYKQLQRSGNGNSNRVFVEIEAESRNKLSTACIPSLVAACMCYDEYRSKSNMWMMSTCGYISPLLPPLSSVLLELREHTTYTHKAAW